MHVPPVFLCLRDSGMRRPADISTPVFKQWERGSSDCDQWFQKTPSSIHLLITQAIPQEFPGDKLRHREEKLRKRRQRKLYLYQILQNTYWYFCQPLKVIYLICIIILSNFSENYHILSRYLQIKNKNIVFKKKISPNQPPQIIMRHAPLPTPADFAEHHLNALLGKLR